MTAGQEFALEQLRQISSANEYAIAIVTATPPDDSSAWLRVMISVHCGALARADGGLPIRERERFIIRVPPNFPFIKPDVDVPHERFAGYAHVQWKRHLCLYQSPETEWNPNDGMFGFMDRLWFWMQKGALNQLDPVGEAIHPPVAYVSSGPARFIVPKANTPVVTDANWIGFAHLAQVHDHRVDVIGWSNHHDGNLPQLAGAAILLAAPMPFEFPRKVADLVTEFAARGVDVDDFLFALGLAAFVNPRDQPLYVLIGTPMRGISGGEMRQHLSAWHIKATYATGLRMALHQFSKDEALKQIGTEVKAIMLEWLISAETEWCRVLEDRPEVVTRRDHAAPMAIFRDKCVAVWGCGALGAHAAIFLAQAGVRKLILKDYGIVSPGILARQPYDESDIGRPKVEALRDRLQRQRANLEIETRQVNLIGELAREQDWTCGADVVVDCTASIGVHGQLELVRRRTPETTVSAISMIINQTADRGLVVVAGAAYSGGVSDVYRNAKIAACRRAECRDLCDAFYPKESRTNLFQPEPGCSDATFVGSASDAAALTGIMLNHAARDLIAEPPNASAHFATLPHAISRPELSASFTSFTFAPDAVRRDLLSGFEVRLAERALKEISYWSRRSARVSGIDVETGGLLFGQRDDALRIIWVSEVTGPPPDSRSSPDEFLCGVEGTLAAHRRKETSSRGAIGYIGMWHTHPESLPLPSQIDFGGMRRILGQEQFSQSKHLLLIAGLHAHNPLVGTYVFDRAHLAQPRIEISGALQTVESRRETTRCVGLALSGGGSRAMAFHLGCLRALYDRGVLPRIDVISAVSGGAVIAAMYAYSDDPFPEFDARVVKLLRTGLHRSIGRRLLLSRRLPQSVATNLSSRVIATAARLFGKQPPLRRWVSRTNALEDTLESCIFAGQLLSAGAMASISSLTPPNFAPALRSASAAGSPAHGASERSSRTM